jgi:hypothetical protein
VSLRPHDFESSGNKDEELTFQNIQRVVNIMYGGIWAIDSRRIVKSMYWDIVVTAPKSTSHLKWANTLVTFNASD